MAPDHRSLALKRPSAFGFVVVAVLIAATIVAAVAWLRAEYQHAETIRQQAERSFDRRTEQITLRSVLDDAETDMRGYLLTDNAAFLVGYRSNRAAIRRHLSAMKQARDPDVPPDYVPKVSGLAARKIADLDAAIVLRQSGDVAGARGLVSAEPARRTTQALHLCIDGMIVAEKARSAAHTAAFVSYRMWLQALVYTVAIVVILLSAVVLFILWRLRQQRYLAMVHALETAERHTTIFNSTSDAILIVAPDGTIDTVNAAAVEMLGHRPSDLVGHNAATLLGLAPGTLSNRVSGNGQAAHGSFLPDRVVRHRDGSDVAVDIVVATMGAGDGHRLIVSLRDIAERKRVERVKDELISTVSHELRTPLTSIIGSLGLLRVGAVGNLSAQAEHLIEIAQTNSERLIRLINDMLDIDRIESGKLAMVDATVDLRRVIDQACLESEGLALTSRVTLACIHPAVPVRVAGDESRLIQVVTNLLSNAIRVSSAGAAIDLSLTAGDALAQVTVADRGPGIPADFRDRIFGRFERAVMDHGGTGLGLAISREIVVRHGGTIRFEDREGGGTRFIVSLPLVAASDAVVDHRRFDEFTR